MIKSSSLYGFELYGNELFDYLRKEYSIPYGDADGLLEGIVKYAYVNFTEPSGKPSTEGIDLLEGIIDFAYDGEHPLDRQEVFKAWCVPIIGERD